MDIERAFLQAMCQATDDWILRGGPFPNDEAIAKIDPRLAAFVEACNSPDDDELEDDE